jgi:very-short-patch-repair endonuclease
MWDFLRGRNLGGYKFRRQHPIGPYVLDFYCARKQLGIELDGLFHEDEQNRKNDEVRTRYLGGRGIRILRFWNTEIFHQPDSVAERILSELKSPIPNSPLHLVERG